MDRPFLRLRFLRPLFGNAERVALLLGFIVTLLGLLGAQFYLGPAQDRLSRIATELTKSRAEVEILRTAQAVDNAFGQFGAMVFALNVHDAKSEEQGEAIAFLQKRALERRHDGVRNYLAQLGLAGAIDYPAMSRLYEQLVADEEKTLSLATYRAANAFEGELALAIVRKTGERAMAAIRLHSDWVRAQEDAIARGQLMLIVSVIGLIVVLVPLLRSGGEKPAAAVEPPIVDERERARKLLRLAQQSLRGRARAAARSS